MRGGGQWQWTAITARITQVLDVARRQHTSSRRWRMSWRISSCHVGVLLRGIAVTFFHQQTAVE